MSNYKPFKPNTFTLLKDGSVHTEFDKYGAVASLAKCILTELKPEHAWSVITSKGDKSSPDAPPVDRFFAKWKDTMLSQLREIMTTEEKRDFPVVMKLSKGKFNRGFKFYIGKLTADVKDITDREVEETHTVALYDEPEEVLSILWTSVKRQLMDKLGVEG